jgi:hypothetical protein
MRKFRLSSTILLMGLFLAACQTKSKEKLTGIWKLEVMDINNTPLRGNSLGNWMWEFNDEGGYLVNVAGAVEKGTYKVEKDRLTLKPVSPAKRPEQNYTIVKLDSVSLNLTTASEQNKTSLYFIKMKGEEVAEKD